MFNGVLKAKRETLKVVAQLKKDEETRKKEEENKKKEDEKKLKQLSKNFRHDNQPNLNLRLNP